MSNIERSSKNKGGEETSKFWSKLTECHTHTDTHVRTCTYVNVKGNKTKIVVDRKGSSTDHEFMVSSKPESKDGYIL